MTGLLILRRLRFFGVVSTTSEGDLAKHTGKSVATVKRYLGRLKGGGLVKIESRRQDSNGQWLPNRYTIQPLGLQYLAHFAAAPWLTDAPQVSSEAQKKTCRQPVSYGIVVKMRHGRHYEFAVPLPQPDSGLDKEEKGQILRL